MRLNEAEITKQLALCAIIVATYASSWFLGLLKLWGILMSNVDFRLMKLKDNGGEPPMNDIEARVRNLETDISVIKSNYATKSDIESLKVMVAKVEGSIEPIRTDMHKEINKMLIWLIASMFTVAGLSIAAAKLLF